ncbi:hypothetical protein EYF80_011885 [Liparis tanakae]|uniref:Uncharacterized protein n=1 Tax=Liparis tanakae TaxID=230148 RepID=A0A4Z2IJ26_9TELE|nr:hypothetical protein EYF80_011885 [Liparis tanakae]
MADVKRTRSLYGCERLFLSYENPTTWSQTPMGSTVFRSPDGPACRAALHILFAYLLKVNSLSGRRKNSAAVGRPGRTVTSSWSSPTPVAWEQDGGRRTREKSSSFPSALRVCQAVICHRLSPRRLLLLSHQEPEVNIDFI